MRSTTADLRRVVSQFRAWRVRRQGFRIPAELWDAAVALLAEHSLSEVCRVLRLNPSQLKKAREARGVGRGAGRHRTRAVGRTRRVSSPCPASARSGFIELPALAPPSVESAELRRVVALAPAGTQRCRLSIESPLGVLTITLPLIEPELVALVRRHVAAVLGEGPVA
jgi:hypothetical protein